MKITDSRTCDRENLEQLARYLAVDANTVLAYYDELVADRQVLAEINAQIACVRISYEFFKGIFRMETIDNIDWFAFQRILLYVLTRLRQPQYVLETGVFYGGNAAFILRALQRNGSGTLVSIDLPHTKILANDRTRRHPRVLDSEEYSTALTPGFMIPASLRNHWRLIEGNSLDVIPVLPERFDLYIHDSEHAMAFMRRELQLAYYVMKPGGIMVVDDIDWSNAFYSFVADLNLYPLLMTDNGKDGLRVRNGIVDLGHASNHEVAVTGNVALVREVVAQ